MTNTDPERDPMAEFAAALFAKDEPDEPDVPDPRPSGFVPGEGSNPATHTDAADMRELTRALFAPDPDA